MKGKQEYRKLCYEVDREVGCGLVGWIVYESCGATKSDVVETVNK